MSLGASLLSWVLKKLADVVVGAWRRPTLDKRIRKAVALWRVSLPADLQEHELWPSALLKLDDTEGCTNDARRALRSALSEGFPDERRWFDALVENWRELHSNGGVGFASLSEDAALPHLKALARSLHRVCAQEPNLALPALLAAVASTGQAQVGAAHAEIERAKAAINGGAVDVGWDILETLRSRQWDLLTARERYRVQALRAHVLMRRGKKPEAAALFIEAASYQPDDDHAKAGLGLGRLLLGETDAAFKIATDVLGRTADSMAGTVFVLSAPPSMKAEAIERALAPALLREADVGRNLSQRARGEGDFAQAERYARSALFGAPDTPEAQAEVARVLLHRVVAGVTDEPTSVSLEIRESLLEAQKLLTTALVKTPTPQDAAQLRLDRSLVHQILGDSKASEADLHEAYRLAPSHPPVAIREAESRQRAGDIEGALNALAQARGDPAASVVRAQLLRRVGTPSALRDAQRALRDVGSAMEDADPSLRAQYCYEVVAACTSAQQFDEAERQVGEMPDKAAPAALRLALLSMIAVARNERERATQLANEAVQDVSVQPDPDVRRLVAIALELAGLLGKALVVWQSLVDPRIPTRDAHRFIACALKSGNDSLALDFCRAARAAGVVDEYLLETQVSLCERYNSLPEALDLVTEQQRAQKDMTRAAEFSIPAAYYAMRLGRLDVASEFVARVPSPTKIDPHRARAVVQVLRAVGQIQGAIEYAYDVARLNMDDREGRLGLFEALGFAGGPEGPRREFDAVAEGAAVRVRLDGADRDDWYVILDRPDVSASRREFRPSHPHVAALMGRRVGDRFEVAGPIQSKTGTISEIVSKEAWLLNQSLTTWDITFPEDHAVVQVKLATGETPQEQFAPMLRMLDEKQRIGKELRELYERELVPAFAVARRLGVHTGFEGFLAFASDRSIRVKCCEPGEVAPGISRALLATEVVVDPTALATLFLLEAEAMLSVDGIRFVVTEGTLQELRQSPLLEDSARRRGTLVKVGEHYVMQEAAPAQAALLRNRLQELIKVIEAKCARVPGDALARLPVALRTSLPDIVGTGTAESIAVAVERGCYLWTDDFAVGKLAEGDLRIHRVTTQWLALALEAKGHLSTPLPAMVSIGMLLHGYRTTALNGAAVSHSVIQAAGDPTVEPLRAVVEYMESATVGGLGLAAAVVKALSDAAGRGLSCEVLEALAHRLAAIVGKKFQGTALSAHISAELRKGQPGEDFEKLAEAFEPSDP